MAGETAQEMSKEEYKKMTGYSRFRAWYLVLMMAVSYGLGELSHFLVGSTTKSMAQELHYGDMTCFRNENATDEDIGNFTCSSIQNSTECDSKMNSETGALLCTWNYNGQGIEYQLLAGPSFILAFSIGGIVLGALADRFNRIFIFIACIVLFSTSTILMGTSQYVWELVVFRLFMAFGEAACKPVSAGLVLSVFPKSMHGAALGLVNWGIYFGYGLSFVVGKYIPSLDILGQGWRWAYYISGMPGFLVAFLMLLTLTDPRKQMERYSIIKRVETAEEENSSEDVTQDTAPTSIWKDIIKPFFHPCVLILLLGACVRQTAGYSWGNNSQLYHDTYFPDFNVQLYLFFTSIIGGSIGIIVGGIVSDRVVKRVGLQARAWVLALSQFLATPLAAGVLLLNPPYNFICLLSAYAFAEMWMGVLFAILIELVPSKTCSVIIGIFLFVMNNIGGNLPVVVNPVKDSIGYREALFIFYPGGYLLSSIVFGCCALVLRRYKK